MIMFKEVISAKVSSPSPKIKVEVFVTRPARLRAAALGLGRIAFVFARDAFEVEGPS
jgi:hypothetical protein